MPGEKALKINLWPGDHVMKKGEGEQIPTRQVFK